jgi:cysteinyl-tRNA synthetase
MNLRLYNTLSKRVEPFEPLHPGRAGVYACGPTIYDFAHIGNFRSFIVYDLVHRVLVWSGLEVRFVMNLTDVDDKTIRGAQAAGVDLSSFTAPFAEAVLADADALGIRPAHLYPRATAYVGPMIELVERLLERGHAYRTDDGSVFFDISSFPDYGRLSGRDLEQARTGDRVSADEYGKDDVRDFALWKGVKPEDETVGAAWDAPWGRGRPGWHLECSAMSLAEVGTTLDLHLGGEDLIFPHHEDEIAQSECATGHTFARFWLHVKHLKVEGEKMSKSRGNFITVRALLDEGVDPAAIRHLLLSAHYRSELNFTRSGLEASSKAVARLLDFEARLLAHAEGGMPHASSDGYIEPPPAESQAGEGTDEEVLSRARNDFRRAIQDDLNVPEALAAVFVFLNAANGALDRGVTPTWASAALQCLHEMDSVLGLLETGRRGRVVDSDLSTWVEDRILARAAARAAKDWGAADAIRDELLSRGIVLEDAAGATRWKKVSLAG